MRPGLIEQNIEIVPIARGRAAVELSNVSVQFPGGVTALSGLSLCVEQGTHLAILGASGSGKSTLLSVIANRLSPTSGSASRTGRLSMIYQDLRLVKQATALQNVLHGSLGRHGLFSTVLAFPKREQCRALELLDRVGIGSRAHLPAGRLSGGEQQRVAIARALMQDPQIILADEPVASLDPANADAIMALLSSLQQERRLTLISVLHDCGLAERYASRVVSLRAGRLAFDTSLPAPAPAPIPHAIRAAVDIGTCGACDAAGALSPVPASPAEVLPKAWFKRIAIAILILAAVGWSLSGVEWSERQSDGLLPRILDFAGRLIPQNKAQLASIDWWTLGQSLLSTFQMVLLGTSVAVLISWPLAALAARNVGPRYLRSGVRLLLNIIRSVPSIIWALLFVAAVGLGFVAGVLALIAYSIGYLTKFFYEAFEQADPGPQGALKEIGASGPQRFLHAVWPASQMTVLSNCIFMLEYNVRAASVLGVVGAGGIGYDLKIHLEYGNYHVVGAIIILLVIVVEIMDRISQAVRARMLHP